MSGTRAAGQEGSQAVGSPGFDSRKLGRVELHQVGKTYRGEDGSDVVALSPTDLVIEPGEFVCLVGPSGCGKTTMMEMVAGFHHPTTGEILVDAQPVTGPGADRGVVFQQANLYPWFTVSQNVELGARLRGVGKRERREQAAHYLAMVGLDQFADRKPYELSGGMQQRAQIARALANDSRIILMDEPFGALDALTRENMQTELLHIWRDSRKTVLFITHDVDEAVYLGTRVLVMSARPGRVIRDVPVDIHVGDSIHGLEARSKPEFVELRDVVTRAIVHAHDN